MAKKPKGEKKKKSIIRRIFKWTGITFLVLLIAIIVLPYVFREQIKNLVIEEANKQLTADFALGDYDITFLSTFPKFTLELDSVTLTGRDDFKGVQLVNMKSLEASLNIWSVLKGDKIEIKTIKLVEPNIHVIVTKEGKANYDIVKPDSTATKEEPAEESNFALKLKSYEIVGGNIIYDDKAGDMYANIVNLNHSGTGDLTADKVDFKTITTADAISFIMSGVPYLAAVKTDATINLLMEFKENSSKFTLQDNAIALNAFKFSFNGFYEMFDKYADMDITLDTKKSGFKELISLIPKIFQSGYESMVTKGSLALDGRVNGKMTDTELPAWNFNLDVANASFKYPDLPASVSNINIKANCNRAQGANLDNIKVDVDKFHAEFVQNTIDATLKLRNPMTDPYIATKILAKVDLATLGKVIPLSKGESYNGKLDADIKLDGKMSDIDKENYEAFNAEGWLSLKEMKYVSEDLKAPVEIQNMMFRFTPQNLALEAMTAKLGASDFQMDGKVDNYLGYMLRDEKLVGKFNYHSNYLNLDEIMGITPTSETPAAETAPAPAASEEAFAIPENIDFDLNASIDKINYDGVDISNLKGNVNLNNGIASLNNLKMNTMGGTVGLDGKYNTQNPAKPQIDLAYDLVDLDINQLATKFLTVDKLAPFAKYAQGRISTKLKMNGDLTPDLSPILESLSGNGDFSTNSIKIEGFEPLTKLANELKMPQLATQVLQNVKTKFEFKDGTVTVKPFNVKLGKISTDINGTTSFNTDINYDMKMNIPKDQVPAAMIKLVEDAIGKVNSLAPGLNLKGLPDIIPVKVGVGGTVMKPTIKSNFKESIMELTGNAKDQIKDLVNKAKDSITTIVKDKIEDLKEDFTAQKNKIMADAQVQADKLTAEASKQANALRAEGNKQAQALLDGAANPIEKKLKQKAADELKKKAEQSAQKVEQEAKTQSDNIMNQARAKADALGK